ncbi:MAG: type I restriction enzyme HsdR N-terminal domain-containing protein [Chitinophagales bacterium]
MQLNFPEYPIITKKVGNKNYLFGFVRRKYLLWTPEEWVRQHVLQFLVKDREYPKSFLAVEKALRVNTLLRRTDVVAYNKNGAPILIVECKAPNVKITQQVFDQIAAYNISLKVEYLFITNGLEHFCCKIDYETNSYTFIEDLPYFSEINK